MPRPDEEVGEGSGRDADFVDCDYRSVSVSIRKETAQINWTENGANGKIN